jgi:hypothetical protein
MNPAMAQMLAQQLGLPADQEGLDPSALLANQASDPLMAALVSSMLQRQAADRDTPTEIDEEQAVLKHELAQAKKTIRKLRENVASANNMANYIAQVFGACPACWGLNQLCPHCRGQGKPGSYQPNEAELLAWVEPALTKLGLRIVKSE